MGGVGGRQKKLSSRQRGPVRDFGPIFLGFGGLCMICRGKSTPHPHVLRVMGLHTLRLINHEESPSRKDSVGCRFGAGLGWVGVGWVGWASDFDPNLGQVHKFSPLNRTQNLDTAANQVQKWIQHPHNRGTPHGHHQLGSVGCLYAWERSSGKGSCGSAEVYSPTPSEHPKIAQNF